MGGLRVRNPTPQRTPAAHCLRHDIRHWTLRVTYLRSHTTLLNALLADSSQEQEITEENVLQ